MKYDVIIPCAEKDFSFLPKVILYIRKNLIDADIVYILCNEKCVRRFRKWGKNYGQVVALNENNIVEGLSFNAVSKILQEKTGSHSVLTGWYLQQFLKYAFARTKYAKDYYLSWDADTLPISPINFFSAEGNPVFTKKFEYHKPYFETINSVLEIDKTADFSFIAEHMMFKTSIVKDLLDEIEKKHIKGNTWYEKILYVPTKDPKNVFFSEFETYGTYCYVKYPNLYKTQQLNTFRCGGMIKGRNISDKQLELLAIDLHTISFEYGHFPFPYSLQTYWMRFKRKIKLYL